MYRYRRERVGLTVNERFTHMIHQLAVTAAVLKGTCSLIPTPEEAEREAAAWNHSCTGYHGD